MKIVKKSQVALLSLSLMVMIAGYINYKYDPEREKSLGKTVHVNGSDVFLYNVTQETGTDQINIYDEYTGNNTNIIETFKLERNNMFSELEETYKTVISSDVESTTKEKYQEKLDEVVKQKHIIGIIEELLKSKGIEKIAIIPTEENINVVVDLNEKLSETSTALIQKIIQDELKIDAKNITIIEN